MLNINSYGERYYHHWQSIIKDEKIPYPQIDGMIMKEEREWLYDRATENDSIVEIGSWMGMSTHCLLSGCKGTVYAIDTFEGTDDEIDGSMAFAKTGKLYETFLKNVGHFSNLRVIKSTSEDAALFFEPKSIDMIFIDGDHRYEAVKKDLELWYPICRKLFCGHDRTNPGVVQALEEFGIKYSAVPELATWYHIIEG